MGRSEAAVRVLVHRALASAAATPGGMTGRPESDRSEPTSAADSTPRSTRSSTARAALRERRRRPRTLELLATARLLHEALPRFHPRFGFEERLGHVRAPPSRPWGRPSTARRSGARPRPTAHVGSAARRSPGLARPWRRCHGAGWHSRTPGRALVDAAVPWPAAAIASGLLAGHAPHRRGRPRWSLAPVTPATRRAALMPFRLPFRPRPESRADLWTSCPSCSELIYNKQLERNLRVCPRCGHHFRLRVDARLGYLLDADSFEERDAGLESLDPLGFVDLKPYPDKVREQRAKTGIRDAAVWGVGRIGGQPRRHRGHGLRLHGRLDGLRRGREGDACRRGGPASGACPSSSSARRAGRACRRARWRSCSWSRPAPRSSAWRTPACPTSASCPTPRRAASSPRSPRSVTSTSPSPTRSSASPARVSPRARPATSCPRASRAPSSSSGTASSTRSCRAPSCARA